MHNTHQKAEHTDVGPISLLLLSYLWRPQIGHNSIGTVTNESHKYHLLENVSFSINIQKAAIAVRLNASLMYFKPNSIFMSDNKAKISDLNGTRRKEFAKKTEHKLKQTDHNLLGTADK